MPENHDIAARAGYGNSNLKIVQKREGRIALKPVSAEEAQALDINNLAQNLNVSGLTLHGQAIDRNNNDPYDQNNTADKAPNLWANAGVR
jgi:hypothetical protein